MKLRQTLLNSYLGTAVATSRGTRPTHCLVLGVLGGSFLISSYTKSEIIGRIFIQNWYENAREKIVEKIPKGVMGSVYFLDKYRINELIERYWNNK